MMKRITITVDPDDYAAFEKVAKTGDVTSSWLIRHLMREFLDRHDREGGVALKIGLPRERKARMVGHG